MNGSSAVPSMEEDGTASLPEPLLEQPEGAPPLSELSADSLALILDGPSLVRETFVVYEIDSAE